jgi:hypothetical protein
MRIVQALLLVAAVGGMCLARPALAAEAGPPAAAPGLSLAPSGAACSTPTPSAAADSAPVLPAPAEALSRPDSDDLIGLFVKGNAAQYQRVADLINTQYPQLSADVVRFLFAQEPDLLTALMPALTPLMQTDYPEIPAIIGKAIGSNDRLKQRVSQLVNDQYSDFLTDLAKIPHGPGYRAAARELIARKFPDLYGAILDLLRQEFPDTLDSVRDQIIKRYPQILGDLARTIAHTFPRLTAQTLNFVIHKYPALLPQIMAILYANPAEEAAAAPDATNPAPASGAAGAATPAVSPAAAPGPAPAPAPAPTGPDK